MTASVPERVGFFDAYPRFYETGNTPAGARLNARFECLIARQSGLIAGRRVLDLGSHDGRWTFAAAAAGAEHVVAVEPRAELVSRARQTCASYGVSPDRVEFHVGEALDYLRGRRTPVDTVLLFGLLYHVNHHVELLRELRASGAAAVIVDTQVVADGDPSCPHTVALMTENVQSINNSAVEIFPGAGVAIVGRPSRAAVRYLFNAFGFRVSEVDWTPVVDRWGRRGLVDYATGERATFVAERYAEA